MKRIVLPGSGATTSRIGFGMSGVAAGSSLTESLARLEAAYDMGVRHFDTAPIYGFGGSEKALGLFARQAREPVTITTKFGGTRPSAGRARLLGTARALAKRTIARIPAVRTRLIAASASIPQAAPMLTAAAFEASLTDSLAAIGVERIDLFLIHELARDRVSDEIVALLERAACDGRIGAWGVGGEQVIVRGYADVAPPVLQTGWSPITDPTLPDARLRIAFGTISRTLPALASHLADGDRLERWSATTGVDLAAPHMLSGLLLRAAMLAGDGIALFTARSPERIRGALQAADGIDDAAAWALTALARAELNAA